MVITFSSKLRFFSSSSRILWNWKKRSRLIEERGGYISISVCTSSYTSSCKQKAICCWNLFRNPNCSGFSKLFLGRRVAIFSPITFSEVLHRAEKIEFGVYLLGFSESPFFDYRYYKCLFQMVRESYFIQEGFNQVREWFYSDVHGIFQCPRWVFGKTQRFIDIQAFNILATFKESYGSKAESFLFVEFHQTIHQYRAWLDRNINLNLRINFSGDLQFVFSRWYSLRTNFSSCVS